MASEQATQQAMTVSPAGAAIIRRFEGFRAEAARLPDGRYVVGHGHVRSSPPAAAFNAAEAERALIEDLAPISAMLNAAILAPVSQNQFDALASFAFSIGQEAFKTSDVLRKLNAGEPIAAACAMDAWRKSAALGDGQVIDILVRRRAAEKALFLDSDTLPAGPSAFLRPGVDHAHAVLSAAPIAPAPSLDAREAAPAPADAAAERLIDILCAEPASAAALAPQPAATVADDADVLELTQTVVPAAALGADPDAPTGKETRAFILLALAGLGLIGLGASALFGGADGAQTVFLLLAAPGVVVTSMAGYYLAKANAVRSKAGQAKAGDARLPGAAFAG